LHGTLRPGTRRLSLSLPLFLPFTLTPTLSSRSLFGSQLLTRVLTFALNVVIARSLSVASYGIAAVQFHLINASIVFLAREGVRRSCLRGSKGDAALVAGSLVAVPAGAVLASVAGAYFRAQDNMPAVMQCVAAFIELLSEPMYVYATSKGWFGLRTGCEAVAMVAKNVVTVWLLSSSSSFGRRDDVMMMSWGQVTYACVLLGCFSVGTWFGVGGVPAVGRVDGAFYSFYVTFTVQAVGKLVLAEGSKAVLAVVTSPAVQGVYGLVNNLGSLVVRTLFQPFEELVFVTFSRTRYDGDGDEHDEHGGGEHTRGHRHEQRVLLGSLSEAVCIVGGIVAAFGPSYAYVALRLLYGARWASSDAPRALGYYSVYVALLAMNGTLEAFLHGVADQKGLMRNNVALVVASLAHVGLSVVMVETHGAVGLLVADGVNMVLRIAYSCAFVHSYFRKECGGLWGVGLTPSWAVMLALGAAAALARASERSFLGVETGAPVVVAPTVAQMARHVVVGCVLLAAVLAVVLRSSSTSLARTLLSVRKQKTQ